jgi:hypothetical protein
MNGKQVKTLASILVEPIPALIEWAAIESLLLAVGCKVIQGSGSRVKFEYFEYNGFIAFFHRPHRRKEATPYQVRDARKFLEQIGIKP